MDTFVFGAGSGADVITDFENADQLRLALDLVGGRSVADVVTDLSRTVNSFADTDGTLFGAGTLFEFGSESTLFLQGFSDRAGLVDDITLF